MILPESKWTKYYGKCQTDFVTDRTLYGVIKDGASQYADKIALEFSSTRYSYKELLKLVDDTASSMVSIGIKKGDVITLTHSGLISTVAVIYAASKIGAVVSFVNNDHGIQELKEFVHKTESRFFFASAKEASMVKETLSQTDKKITVVISRTSDYAPVVSSLSPLYHKYFADDFKGISLGKMPNDVRFIKWKNFIKLGQSSGTEVAENTDYKSTAIILNLGAATGSPHMVEASSQAVNYKAQSLDLVVKRSISEETLRVMSCIKVSFSMGFVIATHLTLSSGDTIVLYPDAGNSIPDREILIQKPDIIFGYNAVWSELMESPVMANAKLSFVKGFISGGELMPGLIYEDFKRFLRKHKCEAPIYRMYGLTETLSAACYISDDSDTDRDLGIPVPGVNIKIIDKNTGMEMPVGTKGEIAVSYPGLITGYYKNPDATAKVMRTLKDGRTWLFTGDFGKEDERGHFFFEGHGKRVVEINGVYTYPESIENQIMSVYGVENCCVVPVGEKGNYSLTAVVIPIPDFISDNDRLEELSEEILTYCSTIFFREMCPSNIEFRMYLPKTMLGENDYEELARQLNSRIEEEEEE